MTKPIISSFPPILPETPKVLVLGTMPGVQSLLRQQYYGHPQNGFWKIMFHLFAELPVPEEYESRKKLLLQNDVAVWDVLESCQRDGSLDANIKNAIPNDLLKLLSENPGIKSLVFNGKESHRLFTKNFGQVISLPQLVMPSTSPANTMKFENKLAAWRSMKDLSFK